MQYRPNMFFTWAICRLLCRSEGRMHGARAVNIPGGRSDANGCICCTTPPSFPSWMCIYTGGLIRLWPMGGIMPASNGRSISAPSDLASDCGLHLSASNSVALGTGGGGECSRYTSFGSIWYSLLFGAWTKLASIHLYCSPLPGSHWSDITSASVASLCGNNITSVVFLFETLSPT
ncbi:hypothetical protein BD779DRAFT_1538783 [Infundibulicybe gibba]|nr:hypothetical protein BD779DRAFT_1538783 [Infundibulicybe gibba]